MGLFSKRASLPDDRGWSLEERLWAPHWLSAFEQRGIEPGKCSYLTNADGTWMMARWSGMTPKTVDIAIFGIGGGRIFVFWIDGSKVHSVTPTLSAVAGVPRARDGQFQVSFFDADAPKEFWFVPGDYETHRAAITEVLDQTGIRI